MLGFITPDNNPVPVGEVAMVAWGDTCKGYPQNGQQYGIRVPFSNNNTVLGGLNPTGRGNLFIIRTSGAIHAANNDLVKLVGDGIPVTFKPKDATGQRDFIQYGTVSDDSIVCPTP